MEYNKSKVDRITLDKLKWRSRRGMLENDLIISKFFAKYEQQVDYAMAEALTKLMNLSDADLLDLFLKRKAVPVELQDDQVIKVLQLMHSTPT